MAVSYLSKQSTWVNKLISFAGGLAALIGATLISGKKAPEGNAVEVNAPEPKKKVVPIAPAPAVKNVSSPVAQDASPAVEKPRIALLSTVKPAALIADKSTVQKPAAAEKPSTAEKSPAAEKSSGGLRIVRLANIIAFQGFDLEIHTGKYRCMLEYFDTYYFSFLGEGVSDQGTQWYKFKVKDRETEKAEIKFKLTGSRFTKLIYQVMIVESFEHFLPGNSPLDEEGEEEEEEEREDQG